MVFIKEYPTPQAMVLYIAFGGPNSVKFGYGKINHISEYGEDGYIRYHITYYNELRGARDKAVVYDSGYRKLMNPNPNPDYKRKHRQVRLDALDYCDLR